LATTVVAGAPIRPCSPGLSPGRSFHSTHLFIHSLHHDTLLIYSQILATNCLLLRLEAIARDPSLRASSLPHYFRLPKQFNINPPADFSTAIVTTYTLHHSTLWTVRTAGPTASIFHASLVTHSPCLPFQSQLYVFRRPRPCQSLIKYTSDCMAYFIHQLNNQ
jgi:hypothetical protein